MKVKTITAGAVQTNSYVLYNENRECIVVDSGDGIREILSYIDENLLRCDSVLLTHGHFDHASGCAELQKRGAKVYMSEFDLPMLSSADNLAQAFGESFTSFTPDFLVRGGEVLTILGERIEVIATPGHTKGSVCYKWNDVLFTGDTLFRLSIGRTDFPGGSYADMKTSLAKLFALSGDFAVLPGHGENTTLNYERKYNPYARI